MGFPIFSTYLFPIMIKHIQFITVLETNSITIIILSTLAWYYNSFQSPVQPSGSLETSWGGLGRGEERGKYFSILLVLGRIRPL
jgi:hypothetical protein